MSKKTYQSPQMKVVKVDAQQMLCSSPDAQTKELNYDETEYVF